MQSNNPVFRRSAEFQDPAATQNQARNPYGNQTYPGNGAPLPGYGQTSTGMPGYELDARTGAPMTIDSVVQKTGIALAVVIVFAAATWILTGEVASDSVPPSLITALTLGSLGAFALSMVNSFKRVISPPLVLLFCAAEGVALGAFSKFIDAVFVADNTSISSNIVAQAVAGTFAAFAGTLAAYKFFDIKVGTKFRFFVIAAVFGMVGLSIMELVLSMFDAELGLFGFGGMGAVFAIIGLVLGVFMLILDFDFVEQGVANRIPEAESWRAAFAITVSLVWIYTNLLRLLAIFSSD